MTMKYLIFFLLPLSAFADAKCVPATNFKVTFNADYLKLNPNKSSSAEVVAMASRSEVNKASDSGWGSAYYEPAASWVWIRQEGKLSIVSIDWLDTASKILFHVIPCGRQTQANTDLMEHLERNIRAQDEKTPASSPRVVTTKKFKEAAPIQGYNSREDDREPSARTE